MTPARPLTRVLASLVVAGAGLAACGQPTHTTTASAAARTPSAGTTPAATSSAVTTARPPAAPATTAEVPTAAPPPPPQLPAAAVLTPAYQLATAAGPGVAHLHRITPPAWAQEPAAASFVSPASTVPVPVSARPGGPVQHRYASPTPKGAPLTMLVLGHSPDGAWTEVSIPERPNGSVGWVPAASVVEHADPWRLDVHQAQHRLLVWYDDTLVASMPVANGKAATPTPDGTFYIDVLLDTRDPSGPYGRWILGTSGFSDAYTTFGDGDALIGLHGNDEAGAIGHSVTHGCVRLDDPDAALLAGLVPLGTQMRILA